MSGRGRQMVRFRMRDGSGEIDFKFLKEDVDRHGNVRVYFRQRGRRKIRLHETPGTPEFLAEYRDALAGRLQPAPEPKRAARATPGTLRWLIESYYASAGFKDLDDSTKRARRGILDAFSEKHGSRSYAQMEPRHVRIYRDAKSDTPEAANGLVKALRQVFALAVIDELLKINPAQQVGYLAAKNPDGFHTWSVEEIQRYEARHPIGSKARLALALLAFLGQRRSDIVRLGPQHARAGVLAFTQFKGRKRNPVHLELPVLPELQKVLDATPSGHLTYLVTEFGKPFTSNGFGNKFRFWCDQAGLPQCSAHGMRKAAATIAAENGASEAQLNALFGWAPGSKQSGKYTRKARQKKLAAGAMGLVVPVPESTESEQSGPLFPVVAEGGPKTSRK